MNRSLTTVLPSTVAALLLAGFATSASADYYHRAAEYEVTITNITKGQVFSPPVLATHKSSVAIFTAGAPASKELIYVAENGMGKDLAILLDGLPEVYEAKETASHGPIPPGENMKYHISSKRRFDRLSVVSMLVNTNDAFLAIDTEKLPKYRGASRTYFAAAYDAGSEANNEVCAFIPGPACPEDNNNERSTENSEEFVYVHNGVHGVGDPEITPSAYDWRNPVAKVTVKRVR